MPTQSRLHRFYTNFVVFDKLIPFIQADSPICHNTAIASWKKGNYVIGSIKRIVKLSVRGKSAFPLFTWDKASLDVELAFQELFPLNKNAYGLSKTMKWSKKFTWTTGKEFVTIIDGTTDNDIFTLSEDCFTKLTTGKN